jgi:hypothetical protein
LLHKFVAGVVYLTCLERIEGCGETRRSAAHPVKRHPLEGPTDMIQRFFVFQKDREHGLFSVKEESRASDAS